MILQYTKAACPGRPDVSDSVRDDCPSGGQCYKKCLELQELPEDIPVGVTKVFMKGNLIQNLTAGSFNLISVNLTSCIQFGLDYNLINWIERDAFTGLTSVEKLYLNHNRLTSLPGGAFLGLPSLRELFLYYNEITMLHPDTFTELVSLEYLNLKSNEIGFLPSGIFKGLPSLEKVRLDYNQLTTLSADVFNSTLYSTSPVKLQIDDNPLVCDMCVSWMKDAVQDGWLAWYPAWSGAPIYPDCTNTSTTWPDINITLPCPDAGKYLKYI